jgi:hypothetical protein
MYFQTNPKWQIIFLVEKCRKKKRFTKKSERKSSTGPSQKRQGCQFNPHCLIKCDDKIREIGVGYPRQVGHWLPKFSFFVENREAVRGPDQYSEKENIVLKLRSVEEPKVINSPDVGSLKCSTESSPGFPHLLTYDVLPAEGHKGKVFLEGFHVALEITVLKKMKVA